MTLELRGFQELITLFNRFDVLAHFQLSTTCRSLPSTANFVSDNNDKVDKGFFHLHKSLSLLAKGIKNTIDIILEERFEKTSSRSKSTLELTQVNFGPKIIIFSESAQHPSHPLSILVFPQTHIFQSIHTLVTLSPTFVITPCSYSYATYVSSDSS